MNGCATKEATERNMGLSVIVFMQLAASGDQLGLHDGAANQFLYLQSQTRGVSGEVQDARSLEFPPAVLIHRPGSDLNKGAHLRQPGPCSRLASGSYCLLFTSGFHRPLGLCEGHQSWRRPNDTQSATSNCNIHDR
jgi:hypothetical protein